MGAAYTIALACQSRLEAAAAEASAAWRAIEGVGTGNMGLTPDAVKFSPAYQEAANRYREAADALRTFNRYMVRTFAREMRADRKARRAALMAAHTGGQA